MTSDFMLYSLAIPALIFLAYKVKIRLELSRAKHPSLAGHAKMSRKVAKLIPFYEYDEAAFFRADDAPDDVAQTRRQAFARLTADYQARYPETTRLSQLAAPLISDLQFTNAYRVPFQFSRYVREHLPAANFAASTAGVTITDLDGNVSYDLSGSYGVNVFGYDAYKHCIDRATDRVRDFGPVLGVYHPIILENVQRLCAISGMDEVSFHMSGTEAVMQAVRLARYHTGRTHLVKFCGAYHGWWDDVQPGVGNPTAVNKMYMLKDMDKDSLHVLRTRKDIACVLVNPLQALHPNAGAPGDSTLVDSSRRPPGQVGVLEQAGSLGSNNAYQRERYSMWLQELRQVCTDRNIVLIFDEVFVGFRLALGGAQDYFGVKADLVTYGKTLGGGLPIGAVCGRADLMKRYRDDCPTDICFARGTFNSHPYVMAAMAEFLHYLDTPEAQAIYANLDATWDNRAAALNQRLQAENLPVQVAHLSSIWMLYYTQPSRYNWMLQYYLRLEGLALSWVGTGRFIFSLNYTDAEFAIVMDKIAAAASKMQKDGWWWHNPTLTNKAIKRRVLREMLLYKLGMKN